MVLKILSMLSIDAYCEPERETSATKIQRLSFKVTSHVYLQ